MDPQEREGHRAIPTTKTGEMDKQIKRVTVYQSRLMSKNHTRDWCKGRKILTVIDDLLEVPAHSSHPLLLKGEQK